MKITSIPWACFLVLCVVAVSSIALKGWMKSDTGKVLMVDPDGKMIVIQEGRAGSERLIHVIVDSDTRLKVNGEVIPIGNLPQEVKVGDVVFVRFLTPGDFRARRITIR